MSRLVRQSLLRLAALVGAVAAFLLITAAIAHLIFDDFATYGDALWSAVQHLLDPGALEDDEGASERVIGIIQLLAGLVFIVGALIAVLEEAISGSLRRVTESEPRVHGKGHVVFIGWNRLAPALVVRLQFALAIGGTRDVAVLIPARNRADRLDIEEALAARAPDLNIQVVVGDPSTTAFDRAAIRTASRVFVFSGSGDLTQPDAADVETVTACLELSRYLSGAEVPAVNPILRRGINADVVVDRLPASWEYVIADRSLGGLAGLAVTWPELSEMLSTPFGPEPDTLVVIAFEAPDLVGRRFDALAPMFSEGLPIGLITGPSDVRLPPSPERVVADGDRIVLLSHRGTEALGRERATRHDPAAATGQTHAPTEPGEELRVAEPTREPRRVVATGPPPALRALLEDLGERDPQPFAVTILHPEREELSLGELPANVTLRELAGTPNEPYDLERAIEIADPNVLVLSADPADGDGADARVLLAALHAGRLGNESLHIVADVFATPDEDIGRPGDNVHFLSRSLVLAKWMAMLVADPDSALATGELLGGANYEFDSVVYEPREPAEIRFGDAYQRLLAQGVVPIGIISGAAPAELNPPPDQLLTPGTQLVVVRRTQPSS